MTSKQSGKLVHSEAILLARMQDSIFYIPKVPNNENPVPFKLNHCEKGKFTFENPKHDMPKLIEYEYLNQKLKVKVSDGAKQTFTLEFNRVAN